MVRRTMVSKLQSKALEEETHEGKKREEIHGMPLQFTFKKISQGMKKKKPQRRWRFEAVLEALEVDHEDYSFWSYQGSLEQILKPMK
uniref:Uncharacterized protein n=1 Tax=Arabidopsis cebennensis TaxID=97979 RepID=B2BXY6_9BRAS|nr:unknown [Arabidopsis cebennensis]